jgi:hypothetical protein
MQFTTATLSLLALATSTLALPAPTTQITIRIANDFSGASASATIPADGTPYSIPALFTGSAIDTGNGNIIATSAQLTAFKDTTKCQFVNQIIPGWKIDIDGRAKNFVDLDGNASKAVPTWLGQFTISCV